MTQTSDTNVNAGVPGNGNVGVAVNQSGDQWRYRWHNNNWWYWTPADRWVYRNGNEWTNYEPAVTAAPAVGYTNQPAYGYTSGPYGYTTGYLGLFGRWHARYDYPACPPVTVSTTYEPRIPAAGQPSVPAAGPIVYTAAKPVVGENANGAAASIPQNGSYIPARSTFPGSGWNSTPRSSWDFGKFPPYSN
jgi:hypothetical protein